MKSSRTFQLYWPFWVAAICISYWWIGPLPFFSEGLWSHYVPPVWQMREGVLAKHFSYVTQLLLFWILCAGLGRAILKRIIAIQSLNPFESLAFSFGLGAGALAYTVLALAAVKALTPVGVATTTGVLLIGNVIFNRDLFSKKMTSVKLRATSKTHVVAGVLMVWALSLYGFYALAPETFYDAMVYHLALPQLYKTEAGFVATPYNFYSGLPFLMQMLYAWALFIHDEILAKLIHWSTAAALGLTFFGLCARYKRPAAASLLACAFLTTPVLGLNSIVSGVDVASSTIVLLAVYALSISVESDNKQAARWKILSAIFCGFAMALKYTNWPLLPILVATLLILGHRPRSIFAFVIVAGLLVAPCAARNVLFYGNPIYPYFHEWFQQNPLYAVDWRAFQADAWARDWSNTLTHPKLFTEAILQPLLLTFRGISSVDYIGPLFLAALPLIFLTRGNDTNRVWLIAFSGLWMFWWVTTTMPRFFLPGLAVLTACFCLRVPSYEQKWLRWSVALILVAVIFHNTAGFSIFAYRANSWNYLIAGQDQVEYLSNPRLAYPSPYFASADWINTHTPQQSKVFVIGDSRGVYLQRPFLTVARWNSDPLFIWVQQSKNAAELKQLFDRENIRFLLINMAEIIRRPRNVRFTSKNLEVLETFFRLYAVSRFADRVSPRIRWTEVWEIVPTAGNPIDRKYSLVEWFRYQSTVTPANPASP